MLGSNTVTFAPRSTAVAPGGAVGGAAYAGPVTTPVSTSARRPVRTPARDHVVLRLRMSEYSGSTAHFARGREPVQFGPLRIRSQANSVTAPAPPVGDCWV